VTVDQQPAAGYSQHFLLPAAIVVGRVLFGAVGTYSIFFVVARFGVKLGRQEKKRFSVNSVEGCKTVSRKSSKTKYNSLLNQKLQNNKN
jgi:hypothetical protein